MKYLVIFLVLVGIAISPYLVSNSFGICVINEDWPDAPCYSKRGEDPSLNQMKQWWSQYYELKGSEWMESKKQELVQAIQNGNLLEWKKGDPDRTRNNVYMYYFVMGDVPNEDGLFAKEYYGIRLLSPLHQRESGIALNDIHCGIDLVLIQKYDGSPACVKYETKDKLIERGWTKQVNESKYSVLADILDRCEQIKKTGTFDGFTYSLSWKNDTHYIDNNSCRWIYLEKYLDENNELNFGQPYDNNGVIIDDLQRVYDWCDYLDEKPDWYFGWTNQTHHIDSEQCEWHVCYDDETYFRGICMTPDAKEKTQSVGELENEN